MVKEIRSKLPRTSILSDHEEEEEVEHKETIQEEPDLPTAAGIEVYIRELYWNNSLEVLTINMWDVLYFICAEICYFVSVGLEFSSTIHPRSMKPTFLSALGHL